MTYTQRLLVVVAASSLFMALYFVFAMPWVMFNSSFRAGLLLPVSALSVGGGMYLARGRRPDDEEEIGFVRVALSAVASALIAFCLGYILMGTLGPLLQNFKHK
jgi:hypothetical protein